MTKYERTDWGQRAQPALRPTHARGKGAKALLLLERQREHHLEDLEEV